MPSRSTELPRSRDAVAEHDVEREERAIGEGEDEPDGLTGDPNIGEHPDADDGHEQRQRVPPPARAERRQSNGTEKLESAYGPQWEPGDRQIEAGVHQTEHDPQRQQGSPLGTRPPPD